MLDLDIFLNLVGSYLDKWYSTEIRGKSETQMELYMEYDVAARVRLVSIIETIRY